MDFSFFVILSPTLSSQIHTFDTTLKPWYVCYHTSPNERTRAQTPATGGIALEVIALKSFQGT